MSSRLIMPRGTWRGADALYMLYKLGLGTGLQLCVDAGDDRSYTTGQTWFDLTGNGNDFFLGANVSATSSDPTFNGIAGGRTVNEYWSFDGSDMFTGTSTPDWVNRLHQNNALFTLAALIYPPNTSTTIIAATNNTNSGSGVGITWFHGSGNMSFRSINSSASPNYTSTTAPAIVANKWNFVALTVDEAAGGSASFVYNDYGAETFDGTYGSPSSGSAGSPLRLCSRTTSADSAIAPNGTRMAMFMAWEGRTLTVTQLQYLERVIRTRFGV